MASIFPDVTSGITDITKALFDLTEFMKNPGAVLWDFICGTMLSPFGKAIGGLLQTGNETFQKYANHAVELLQKSPSEWNADGWNAITIINNSFIGLGASLVIIFWCIKLCSDNLDIRQTMRPETMLKEIMVLIVAEWFVCSSFTIFTSLFGLVDALTQGISINGLEAIVVPENVLRYLLTDMDNIGVVMVNFALAFLYMLILSFSGFVIVYQAYVRMFKVMIIAPYASLVTSTIAGPHSISHSSIAFFKYALSTILEAVTMILVIKLGAVLFSSGLVGSELSATVEVASMGDFWSWASREIVLAFVMVGGIKEASIITQRALG